ncbi:MAG: GTP-binding protein [Clostridiales bacterium]|nr:GTP-binding protein [Clostridiales bacterium]
MTKIDIISGFLGAGKTTLIKKLLDEALSGEKLVLIENEFGEIGIDSGFLKDSGIEITEMNSGCICCSLVGDFGKNLREVIARFHPERILIEPSGVGKLSDVKKAVAEVEKEQEVKQNALVTVVNAGKASKQMKAFGEFFNNQIENATTIILSRTQNVTPEQLALCVKQIQSLNSNAAIITTPWEQISGEQILRVMEGRDSLEQKLKEEHHHEHPHGHHHGDGEHCGCGGHGEGHHHGHPHGDGEHCGCGGHGEGHHHAHHHADEVFASWGKETPQKFKREKLEEILKVLSESDSYGTVLRAKGMVEGADGSWIYFDLVPGEYELRDGKPDYTGRLCVIGTKLDEQGLARLFEIA